MYNLTHERADERMNRTKPSPHDKPKVLDQLLDGLTSQHASWVPAHCTLQSNDPEELCQYLDGEIGLASLTHEPTLTAEEGKVPQLNPEADRLLNRRLVNLFPALSG